MEFRYNKGRFKSSEYAIKGLRAPIYKALHKHGRISYDCPICDYSGPFMDKNQRKDAKCPKCGELERTRLQLLVLKDLYASSDFSACDVLHVAPENALRKFFRDVCENYSTADLHREDVDYNFDVQEIPFNDGSFNLVFASHVLEYPEDDVQALREFRRILRPGGVAILPVPVLHERTIDHAERAANRMMHEPGLDYFDRMRDVFANVSVITPDNFSPRHQLKVHIQSEENTSEEKEFLSTSLNLVPVCRA